MACPSDENLIRFVSEEVTSKEMQEFQNHIEGCERCREEVSSIRGLDKALPEIIYADPSGEGSDNECPEAMTLAGYLDHSMPQEERADLETHLAGCQTCLDYLVATADRLPTALNQYLKTPAHLLNKAVRLGDPSMPWSPRSENPGVLEKIRQWFEAVVPHPRLAFAGVGACAIVLLAVLIAHQTYEDDSQIKPIDSRPTLNKLAQRDGRTARPVEDVVAESKLDLNGDLKRALIDHDPKIITRSQNPLFAIIERKAPQITIDQIKDVEIEQNLLIAIASVSDLAGQVKLRLYKDGVLVIGVDS